MKGSEELLFGTIAVREGFATPAQIDECVRVQQDRAATGAPAKLGLLMIERGFMSNEQVAAILEIQKRRPKIIDATPQRGGLFGQLCLDGGYIEVTKLQECLAEQETLAKKGAPAMLGQIMLRKGFISTDQFLGVLKLQRRRVQRCAGCDTFYNVEEFEEGIKFICRRCGTIVQVQTGSGVRQIPGRPDTIARLTLQEKQDIGAQCGRYVIVEEIGRGGMGIVYKALHRDLNQVFALKVLKESDLAGPEMVTRFKVEAQAAARMKHPNIVGIHDAGEEAGVHYIAMDLIDGQSLAYKIAQRPKVRDIVGLLEKVARGVQHAHEHNIVHRDLKPGNVMVDKHNEPHIMDFGLAKFMDTKMKLTREGSFLGTPYYMSPEQVRGEEIDHQSDIYAMGVMLYEILSGRPPHIGQNSVEIFNKILNEDPPNPGSLNPKIHPDLVTICLKAIEKEKRSRYQSAGELADDLHRYLEGEAIQARPVGFLGRVVKRLRKNPAGTVAGFSLVLLALTGTILLGFFIRNRTEFETAYANGRDAYIANQHDSALIHLESARRLRPLDADVALLVTKVREKLAAAEKERRLAADRQQQLVRATPKLLEARALLDDLARRILSDALDADVVRQACAPIVAAFTEALSLAPDSVAVHLGIAETQALRGDTTAAIDSCSAALSREKGHPDALNLRARLRLRKALIARELGGRPTGFPECDEAAAARRQAIADFGDLARTTSSSASAAFAEAALAELRGHSDEARQSIEAYLQRYSTDPDALRLRGGKDDLRRAIRHLPTDAGLRLQLAVRLPDTEAEAELIAATRTAPEDPIAWCALARFVQRMRPAEAEAAWQRVPSGPYGLLNLGRLRLAAGDAEGALVPLTRAAQAGPDDPLIFASRAEALMALKRNADAYADADRVVQLMRDRSAGYELRGRVELEQQSWDAALADFEQVVLMEPGAKERIKPLIDRAKARSD